MALSMKEPSMKDKLILLVKLLPSEYMTPLHDKLVGGEIKLETKFYNLAFYWGDGHVVAANMPLSTPTLMSLDKDDPALGASKFEMLKLYKELAEEYNKSHPASSLPLVKATSYSEAMNQVPDGADSKPKTKPPISASAEAQAKKNAMFMEKYGTKKSMEELIEAKMKMAEMNPASEIPLPTEPLFANAAKATKAATAAYDKTKLEEAQKILDGAKKTPFLSTATPIKLKDATTLGQRVKGTSPDSKYFLIAKKGGLKLAMRNVYKHGTVSFRAEFNGMITPTDVNKLKEAGMQFQNSGAGGSASTAYASMHLNTVNQNGELLPLGRIAGSFLMGLGINWDEMIMNPTEVPEDTP